MKTRQELMQEADELFKKEVSHLESKISQALHEGFSIVKWHCGQELYFKLKSELDKSGFRSIWSEGGRTTGPSMTIYI